MKLQIPQYHAHSAPLYNHHLMDMIHELNGHSPQYTKHVTNNDRHYRHYTSKTLSFTALSTPQYTKNNITHITKQHTPIQSKNNTSNKDRLSALLAQSKLFKHKHCFLSQLTHSIILLFDTGASMSMTPRLEDFITPPKPVNISPIKGIAGSLQPIGIDTVRYTIKDDNGDDIQLFIPDVLYCPAIPITLISPQCLCKTHGPVQTSRFTITSKECYLHIHDRRITIPYPNTILIVRFRTIREKKFP